LRRLGFQCNIAEMVVVGSKLFALLALSVPLAVMSASCGVGDAICTDKTVEEDREDSCPYGPPGGPQRKNVDGCVVPLDDSNCTKTFADDVYPILIAPPGAQGGGGCTLAACHGPDGSGKVDMVVAEDATPDELYEVMAAVRNEAGDPYVAEGDSSAYFYCNVKAIVGGGSAMPPSGFAAVPENLAVLEEWARCGMKNDGVGTGGGGVGGSGGGGGSGGAGGGL
jgi:uncharacterized membrane protein YgcG